MRLTIKEISEILGVTRERINFKIARGDFPSFRKCGECRITYTIDEADLKRPVNQKNKKRNKGGQA